jgi:putative transposase
MKKRFSDEQIISILREAEAGVSARELCRKHAISDATFYACRKKYGGMEVPELKRLKLPEEENVRLKKLPAEAMLDRGHFRWLWGESTDDRPETGSR